VQRVVSETMQRLGRIDILVNNAGATWGAPAEDYPLEAWDKVMNLNVRSVFLFSQAVAKASMIGRQKGRILNIASIAGKEGNAGIDSYSASKAGVTVNALAPAVIRTAMVDALPTEQVDYMTAKIPMRRCGTLDEVANVAAFIVSRENSFTTGFCYDLSGGRAVY
jgi:3-oxoacyl-[acyl-carrier protein] reductase